MNKKTLIILIVIFLLTFFLRVYRLPQFISYHQDQVRDLIYVSKHFNEKKPILLGPKASVGDFYLPPFWYYLMSISYFFSPSPLAPAIFTALLSSLTVFFIFLLTKELINEKTAYLTSLIYSFSPLSIEYSRFAWNPNPIPFFTIIGFYFLYRYLKNNNFLYMIISAICANLSLQLHYQGAIIFLFYFLILIINKKINLKIFFIFLIINLILIAPFFIYEITNNFPNIKGIINFLFKNSNSLKFFGIPFFLKFILFNFSNYLGNILFFKNKILGFISLLTIIIGLIIYIFKKRKTNNLLEKLLNYFFLFSIFMIYIYKNSLIDFYLLFLIPFVIIYFINVLYFIFPRFILKITLIILLLNIIFIPVYKKYDNTYSWINELTEKISKTDQYCVKYDIFKETFIEDKIRYMFSIKKNQPLNNCLINKNIYYICEPPICKYNKKNQYRKIEFNNKYYLKVFQINEIKI